MNRLLIAVLISGFCATGHAQVVVKDPWVRATVAEQKATGAFMELTSPGDVRLLEVRSSAARIVEIHETKMDNNIMRMRAVAGLDVPAGKGVQLKPGGFHVMLIDLNQTLKAGDSVPLTLVFEGKDGKRETIDVKSPVRPLQSGGHSHDGPGAHKH
jgi:periplasmic copper chaperone A